MRTRTILSLLFAIQALLFAGEAKPLSADQISAFVKSVAEGSKLNAVYDMLLNGGPDVLPALEAAAKNEKSPLAKSRLERLVGVFHTRDILAHTNTVLNQAGGMEYDIEAAIQTGGQKIQTKGHGTFAADGKHFRLESVMSVAGQSQKLLVVGDGEKIFRETSILGPDGKPLAQQANFTDISALKSADDIPQNEVVNEFNRIQREFDVYSAEETKLDGQDVIVLKAVSNKKRDRPVEEIEHTGQFVLRKSDWMPLSSDDSNKEAVQKIRFSNIKIGEKVDDKLFIYKAPNGVDVQKAGK